MHQGQVYSGQGPAEQYLVGPAIASYTPCSAGTPGCIGTGSGATPAPAVSTAGPTEAPDTTDTTEAGTVASTSLRSTVPSGSPIESPINVDGSILELRHCG